MFASQEHHGQDSVHRQLRRSVVQPRISVQVPLPEMCNGYISTFQTNTLSTVSTAAQVVSTLFGGLLGRAAQSAQSIEQAVAGPQHDAALKAAVEEIAPSFKQCTRCGQWVCEPVCWNKQAQLCETCAPDLDEEITSPSAGGEGAGLREGACGRLSRRPRPGPANAGGLPEVRRAHAGREVLSRMRHGGVLEAAVRELRRAGGRVAQVLPGMRPGVWRLR